MHCTRLPLFEAGSSRELGSHFKYLNMANIYDYRGLSTLMETGRGLRYSFPAGAFEIPPVHQRAQQTPALTLTSRFSNQLYTQSTEIFGQLDS